MFGYALREAQDVARVTVADGSFEMLLTGSEDQRNPVYSPDGKKIYFASDKTGIFNIYTYDVQTKSVEQVSNVLGGAFMPSVNQAGDVAFASYTSGGFKLNLLRSPSPQSFVENSYVPGPANPPAVADSGCSRQHRTIGPNSVSYDDTQLPQTDSETVQKHFHEPLHCSVSPDRRIQLGG